MKNPFRRKSASEIFIEVLGFIALTAVFIAMGIDAAQATGRNEPPPVELQQDQDQLQGQVQGQHAQGGDGGTGTGTAHASGSGTGTANASNDGVTSNNATHNTSTFFSFNSSIPAAGKCFGAVNGGGGDGAGGGFLGWNFLNKENRRQHAQGGDGGTGTGTAHASGSGTGTANASNDGVTSNNATHNTSTFFSFNSSIPAAGKCFGAVNGGGGDGAGGGFLGWNFLNKDCWYSALAAEEKSVEVRARLKCGSKAFRNAISYMEKRRDRQAHCVGYMVGTFIEQIEFEKAQVQAMLDAQTLIISDHVTTATEKTTDTLVRVVETCSDCYGEKTK